MDSFIIFWENFAVLTNILSVSLPENLNLIIHISQKFLDYDAATA